MPVIAGLAIGVLFIAAISSIYIAPSSNSDYSARPILDSYQSASNAGARPDNGSSYTVYIFLFKVDRSLQNQNLLAKLPSLYYQVENMTGIQEPSQQAMFFTATKQGIYDPTGTFVTGLAPAKIIVSDGVSLPDGTRVTEDKIASNATFYITPIGPTTLYLEDSGKFFAYHRDYYPNPKNIGTERTVTAIEFVIAGSDYEKFTSKYEQIKSLVESLRP